ncbi:MULTISPECIES: hypothetical protein [unclassified Tolypothrix]|uniref:hypothetical protein n=1 Tax=unclassified Tolypothrix TaxID=2649714 RepID=UPI0012D797BC|nr:MULTISPECIES: hypothetical protein [unclassified Tolypothrix]MBE9084132.1 hypothetical protein [Tolypothrix sp. LEGE 11397]MBE9084164.1 hypothetical protein [Tolypothrix sp. LEGE 11397]UYD31041.1 hypothetical protein HGR01_40040 [Tolypothrix sp. PCC 7712]UYD31044.1 hypothetical protein HGR01_40055 [Tolypothrix sp. PCC 7712]
MGFWGQRAMERRSLPVAPLTFHNRLQHCGFCFASLIGTPESLNFSRHHQAIEPGAFELNNP